MPGADIARTVPTIFRVAGTRMRWASWESYSHRDEQRMRRVVATRPSSKRRGLKSANDYMIKII